MCFGPNSIAVQSWEVCALKIEFFQWRAYISYRELYFKVPCAAVHELYRSNLVCTLIPILKGVFWSEQHSCTVLGSMCDQTPSQSFANEYAVHFLTGTPAPGIAAEWELYQQLLPQISIADFDAAVESWTKAEDTALLVVRPSETEAASDDELTASTLAQLQAAGTLDVEPYADELGDVPAAGRDSGPWEHHV